MAEISGIHSLPREEWLKEFEQVALHYLRGKISQSKSGHCIRITDLDTDLMVRLCRTLRDSIQNFNFFVLKSSDVPVDVAITSTKLVELRNPLEDGSQRHPLLVFIPHATKASAEDSFGVATFQAIETLPILLELERKLLLDIPEEGGLRTSVKLVFQEVPRLSVQKKIEYLLMVKSNGIDAQSLGAALFELGVIPDFSLFDKPDIIQVKIRRNLEAVDVLRNSGQTERGRVLSLELRDSTLAKDLAQLLMEAPDFANWSRAISMESSKWKLSFDKWKFLDDRQENVVPKVTDVTLDIPSFESASKNRAHAELVGEQVLVTQKMKKFSVEFTVEPIPSRIPGLQKFIARIVSEDSGDGIGLSRQKKIWEGKSTTGKIPFGSLSKVQWEDGWYRVEISAINDNGVNLISRESTTHRSEPFYVLASEATELPEASEKPKHKPVSTLAHAQLAYQFQQMVKGNTLAEIPPSSVIWSDENKCYEVRSQEWGIQQIFQSAILRAWELKFLSQPEGPFSYKANESFLLQEEQLHLPVHPAITAFLTARKEWCAAIINQPDGRTLVSCNLEPLLDVGDIYTSTYQKALHVAYDLARQDDWSMLDGLQKIDQVVWFDPKVKATVSFASPTHPLIVRWWLDWWKLSRDWKQKLNKKDLQAIISTRDSLLDSIKPCATPPFLEVKNEAFQYFASLDFCWGCYVPSNIEQRQMLRESLEDSLGCKCSLGNIQSADASFVANRIRRYLYQHPYIGTLVIRALLPGKGLFLVAILEELAEDALFNDLKFDFHLFVNDPQSELEGEGLQELIQSGLLSTDELGGDHLRPKFRVAVRDMNALFDDTAQAHLTFLFDAFPSDQIQAFAAKKSHPWLNGLIHSESIEYREDGDAAYWIRSFPQANDLDQEFALGTAALAVRNIEEPLNLGVQLFLSPEMRRRIHKIHELSDWVFCLDRNLGIEYFDHGGSISERPDYLIDHSPNFGKGDGRSLVITSRSTTELLSLVEPVLAQYPFKNHPKLAELLLFELRCLSGRLTLKLITNPTQRAEAVGLALSRLYLEHNGTLEQSILVPMDAHQDLYTILAKQSNEIGRELSLQRTDLALFRFDPIKKILVCRLVEVKCYKGLNTQGWIDLQSSITKQLNQSKDVLSAHFAPDGRPDQQLKSWELTQVLKYYLRRSIRYGSMSENDGYTMLDHLDGLSEPFSLVFELDAFVFDFSSIGESQITDSGITFWRIGVQSIQTLIDQRLEQADSTQSLALNYHDLRNMRAKTQTVSSFENTVKILPSEVKPITAVDDAPSVKMETKDLHSVESQQDSNLDSVHIIEPVQPGISSNEFIDCDTYLGVSGSSPQFGILGESLSGTVGLDLNQTHTISLFGVQGGGKSYSLGSILEMACLSIPGINTLPAPLASVVFHYSPTMDYKPEFTSMVHANDVDAQIQTLREKYGAMPVALKDIVLIVPPAMLEERKEEYPGLTVQPLLFKPSELKSSHWSYLMGVVGNDSLYIKQVKAILKSLRKGVNVQTLRLAIENANMADHLKDQALARLELAEEYIKDSTHSLGDLIVPGRLVIVDMRDEHIEREEALGLFVVLLQLFSEVNNPTKRFNKLFVFDEAHKYMASGELVNGLIEIVREMRHKGSNILIASQDPPSLPIPLLELSSQMILHKFTSPQWLKHLQKANSSLDSLTPEKMASLGKGEAYVWSRESSDPAFSKQAVKISCRPRVTKHGGDTKKAVS